LRRRPKKREEIDDIADPPSGTSVRPGKTRGIVGDLTSVLDE
jgi:hypothetical protein